MRSRLSPGRVHRMRGCAGFTLAEVGVAVALFSVVLLAAGGVLTATPDGSSASRVRTSGTFHLQHQVGEIYRTDFETLTSGQADTTLSGGIVLRASWTVTELVPDKLKQVDVTVHTLSNLPGGHERTVRLYVANRAR